MSYQITPEERSAAYRNCLTEQDYIARLGRYTRNTGTDPSVLRALNAEDLKVAHQMGIPPEEVLKSKLSELVETVVRET